MLKVDHTGEMKFCWIFKQRSRYFKKRIY